MKIALISPTFYSPYCGLGNHSIKLKKIWESLGIEVQILTAIPDKQSVDSFDVWVIQYTPNSWSGLPWLPNLSLLRWCFQNRISRRVFLIAHELHYPVQFNVRGLIYGVGQWLQFCTLKHCAAWTFFTYATPKNSFPIRSSVVPVGSNIYNQMDQAPIPAPGREFRLLHFGGNHPTHQVDWTIHALKVAQTKHSNLKLKLVWVGLNNDDKAKIFESLVHYYDQSELNQLFISTEALGKISEAQVSTELQKADLVLAPFLDGMSTRRGSVMAALSHACIVITPTGWATDPAIPWHEFLILTKNSLEDYSEAVSDAVRDMSALSEIIKCQAKQYYEQNFSWKVIGTQMQIKFKEILNAL